MATAGSSVEAGRVSGERIATQIDTADSGTFTTTETIVSTVVAALVNGRTYRVKAHTRCSSSVAADRYIARLREDNATGTAIQGSNVDITAAATTHGWPADLEAEYVAVATGNKTFVLTGVRGSGTGNCFMEAGADHPSYLYVDYVRG
jgi:hypothetical protein